MQDAERIQLPIFFFEEGFSEMEDGLFIVEPLFLEFHPWRAYASKVGFRSWTAAAVGTEGNSMIEKRHFSSAGASFDANDDRFLFCAVADGETCHTYTLLVQTELVDQMSF